MERNFVWLIAVVSFVALKRFATLLIETPPTNTLIHVVNYIRGLQHICTTHSTGLPRCRFDEMPKICSVNVESDTSCHTKVTPIRPKTEF